MYVYIFSKLLLKPQKTIQSKTLDINYIYFSFIQTTYEAICYENNYLGNVTDFLVQIKLNHGTPKHKMAFTCKFKKILAIKTFITQIFTNDDLYLSSYNF